MNSLEYRNKRDKSGLLLKNSAYSLTADFVDECIEILSKYQVYDDLVRSFNKQYIEFYFRKLIFYEFLPIAHQLTIKQWDDENYSNNEVTIIDSSSFKCRELLNTISFIKNDNIIFDPSGSLSFPQRIRKNFTPLVKKTIAIFSSFLSPFFINNQKVTLLDSSNSSRIAVFLTEGVDLTKRSNIFWLPDSNIDPLSVVVYFSLGKKDSESIISKLKENNLQWVNLRGWKSKNRFQLGKSILDSKKKYKKNQYDKTQKWLLNEVTFLINDINYWYAFFKQLNIRIHSDNTEYGVETIVKQIALDKLNGVSFVSQRSYPDSLKGKFYCYYPTDIFFAWGVNASQKIKEIILNKNNPKIGNILISGCQQVNIISENKSLYLERIKKNLLKNGAKTIIMFLDSNHEFNSNWQRQSIDTKELEKIYISLLKSVIDNEEIALIIKPKKMQFFNSLLINIGSYLEDAKQTGRIHIADVFGEKPSEYARISDLIIGITSEHLPASIIECAILKKPSVFYDYSDLSSIEKDFYSWADQKVVFNKIDSLMSEIKLFSENRNKDSSFGDWGIFLDNYDFFQDYAAHSRVGFYLTLLLQFFNSGADKKMVLRMANNSYSKEHGKDEVLF